MEEFIKIMSEWTKQETDEIIEKLERKEELNNFEKSFIYKFIKFKEEREKNVRK